MRVNILLPEGGVGLGIQPFSGIYTATMKFKEKLEENGIKVDLNGKGYNYDIFHFQWPTPLFLPKLIKAKKRGIKIINHAHTTVEDITGTTSFTFNKKFLNLLGSYMRYFYNSADIVLTPSKFSRECLIKRGVEKPIIVLSNGIDIEKFKFKLEKRKLFREKYNLSNEEIVVYGVGILFLRKGLETFRKTAEVLTNLKFYWAGGGLPSIFTAERKKLQRILSNTPSNLKFLGFIDDITEIHSGGDIFLFPSFAENQGIALLEALSCGRPAVVRDLPSYDWAVNNYNCLIARTNKEFLNRVEKLSEDQKLRNKLSKNAINAARKHDIKVVIKKLINIYDGVLE